MYHRINTCEPAVEPVVSDCVKYTHSAHVSRCNETGSKKPVPGGQNGFLVLPVSYATPGLYDGDSVYLKWVLLPVVRP